MRPLLKVRLEGADPSAMSDAAADSRPLVLVAEDDDDIRRFMGFVLRRAGYDVVECKDGHDALKATVARRPELLLVDIGMPKLDGHALCRIVQSLGEVPPPLIFVSARTRPRDRIEGMGLGAEAYITKPFTPDELVAQVRTGLGDRGAGVSGVHG